MRSIDRFVALYDIAQYSAVQRIVLGSGRVVNE